MISQPTMMGQALLASFALAVVGSPLAAEERGAGAPRDDGRAAIRPFRARIPDEAVADLRQRLAATRFPDKETVADESQGAQLAKVQALVRYWATEYDWRSGEAKLNAYPSS